MFAAIFMVVFGFLFWICPMLAAYALSVQRGRRTWVALIATFGLGWVGYIVVLVYYLSTPQRNRPAATA